MNKKLFLMLMIIVSLALLSACQATESNTVPVVAAGGDPDQPVPVKANQVAADNISQTELLQYEMETEVNDVKMTVKSFVLDPENDQILLNCVLRIQRSRTMPMESSSPWMERI